MIRIYTKQRHISKLSNFFKQHNLDFEIFTVKDQEPPDKEFDLGVSYCYPRKIVDPILSAPKKGFINYHPGPLPKYKGPHQYQNAIDNKETKWGVTVHFMDAEYDTGPIVKVKEFELHQPPVSIDELGAISHYFLFTLFKETILDIFAGRLKGTPQSEFNE